jgi:hypothetical protein
VQASVKMLAFVHRGGNQRCIWLVFGDKLTPNLPALRLFYQPGKPSRRGELSKKELGNNEQHRSSPRGGLWTALDGKASIRS